MASNKWRKCNRSKRVSGGCANNSSCNHCVSSRTHCNEVAVPADEAEQRTIDSMNEVKWWGWAGGGPDHYELSMSDDWDDVVSDDWDDAWWPAEDLRDRYVYAHCDDLLKTPLIESINARRSS